VAPRSGVGAGNGRLAFLDGLRGLAALYVVISHAWDTAMPPGVGHARALTAFLGFGRYAVALFIVVSGCSLGLTAWRHGLHWPGGAAAFMRRRVRRIWPPYLAAVAFCSLLGATVLSHAQGTLWDGAIPIRPAGVAVHSLLLQDVIWRGPAGSTAFWSIAIEFHIYFFFLGMLVVLRKRSGGWLPVVVALYALAGAVVALPRAPLSGLISGMYPSLYGLFVLGVVASGFLARAPADDRGRRAWERVLLWLSAVGIVVEALCRAHFNVLGPLNDLWLGPLLALLVTRIGAGALPGLAGWLSRPRAIWLGQCSYSMYLIHPVVLEAVWRLAVRPLPVPLLTKLAAELAIGTTASIAAARAFYLLIERHFAQPEPRPLPEPRVTGRRRPRVMRNPAAALRAPPVSRVGE
jgi:peptidoglycan/LPS O-acetylase OafA/YrhL